MRLRLDSFSNEVYTRPMYSDHTTKLPFMKMHGLGNDFVVIDERGKAPRVDSALAVAMGDRHRGVGFDQLAVIAGADESDLRLTFYNADGSLSGACGNATRCIARYEMDRTGKDTLRITTARGTLHAVDLGDGVTSLNMGHPQTDWRDVPLALEMDTLELPLDGAPTATGMGNPHCTFFVDDIAAVDLATLGARYENDALFPERANVQFAQIMNPNHIRMRVWERGVGITLASGSSSCATTVAAVRRGLTGRDVRIDLDGGTLMIAWRDDGVWMSGPTAHVFDGVWLP
jgi:diaminopimelate epimerase